MGERAISNEHAEVRYEIEDASNRAATASKEHANNWIERLRWLDGALGGSGGLTGIPANEGSFRALGGSLGQLREGSPIVLHHILRAKVQ